MNPGIPRHYRLLLSLCACFCLNTWVYAQSVVSVDSTTWRFIVDGSPYNLEVPDGSRQQEIVQLFKTRLQEEGFFLARVDSVVVHSNAASTTLYGKRGERAVVHSFHVEGMPDSLSTDEMVSTRIGRPFEPDVLEADLDRLLVYLEKKGYLLAQIKRPSLTLQQKEGKAGLAIVVAVEADVRYNLAGIVLAGAKKTSTRYVEYLSGLRNGEPVEASMLELQQELMATHMFSQVGVPEVIPLAGQLALIRIPIVEETPGAFDLVLGYQPAGTAGGATGLVGNGNLLLRNLFGRGRTLSLRLYRQPGQISQVRTRFSDPFFANLPFRVEAGFEGLQQDSTYNQQHWEGIVGYRFLRGVEALLSVRSEITEPAQAGIGLINGEQAIPNTRVVFWGGIVRMDRRDQPLNPSRGFLFESRYERGQKTRQALQVLPEDTTSVRRAAQQERWSLLGHWFIPVGTRQVFAVGGEGRILVSDQYDESELFRFGGTTSLRGYEEDRFRGRLVSRLFGEYRYRFERLSYGYLFFDAGYYEQPAFQNKASLSEWLYGYGIGFQFDSGVGLINTSFALGKGDSPSQAKVHVGLSLAL